MSISQFVPTRPSRELQTFPNPRPGRTYEVLFETSEFTCVCPMTGQPDFGRLTIRYVPARVCVELKSLKLYLWSFRNEGHFHEAVTNQILDDLVRVLKPRTLSIEGAFNIRGGIATTVVARYDGARRSRRSLPRGSPR